MPYEEPIDVEIDLNWYLQLYLIAAEYWADSFEAKVMDLIETEVSLSGEVIYDERKLQDRCRHIEDFYNSNALPMSLFDLMDNCIHASDKYMVEK